MTARQALAFFSCAIKSGELWSDTCQQAMDDALAEIKKLTAERDELRRRIVQAPRGTPRVPNVMGSQRFGPVARIEVDDAMVGNTYALVRLKDDEL